ncbi:MAG: glycosyltransferase family 4 protein, partial [Chloroflexi bacterium]|nr:glycosyltransferase family 4 protein [Chloroflexota bacterium]
WLNPRLRREASYPILSIVHHLRSSEARPAWLNRAYAAVERRYLRSVDGFIFNSRATQRSVEALAGAGRRCVIAYPAGDRFAAQIGDEEIAARAVQPGPLRLLFVGNLIPRKGLHTLLDALGGLPEEAWRLDVVGRMDADPAYARRMSRRSQQPGLHGRVNFLGALEDAALAQLMRASHALVTPSSYEGFGIVYLEGMGFGLPAAASSAGAAGEVIRDGEDGYLPAPGDVRALRAALLPWLRDRGTLLAMSLAARRRYERHPTWEAGGRAAHEFIRSFVKND